MQAKDPVALERAGWAALASDGPTAAAFYADVLDADPVMLLPGGLVMRNRAPMIDAMAGQPWATYELDDVRALELTPEVVVVTYAVVAQREGAEPYSALMSSTYVRRGNAWRLAVHQQTPR